MNAAADSDAELILSSQTDPARFADIFRRHYRAVYAYAVRSVGVAAGEDIAAEVFVRAFAARHRFDPTRHSALPWLFGIAAHLVADHYRRGGRRIRALRRAIRLSPGPVEFEADAVARLDAQATVGAVSRLLGELRPEERDVIGLFALAELPYAEIAQALDIPMGTVKSRLNRGRATLRNLLAVPTRLNEEERDE